MTNIVYRQIKAHIKDGLLKTAATLLRAQERDARYTECYCLLYQMALRLAQSVGPLEYWTYLEILQLSLPHINLKGGVKNE